MIRERLIAEKHQMTPTPSTPTIGSSTPAPEWHDDLTQVTQAIRAPYFNEDSILQRSRLIRAVKTAPHDVNSWRKLLTQINDDRNHQAQESKSENDTVELHSEVVRLFETATRVIPRSSANRYSPIYLSIWLDLASIHEEMNEDVYMARDVFKQLKNNRIGTTFPSFWTAFADFELRQNDPDKAAKLRAEIPRRCHNTATTNQNKNSSLESSNSERKNISTSIGSVLRQKNLLQHRQQASASVNSTPNNNVLKDRQASNYHQSMSSSKPLKHNESCTPPTQQLPKSKRMNVSNSPELMRKDVNPASFEIPDLLSDDNPPYPSNRQQQHAKTASRNMANSSSFWKPRVNSQQPQSSVSPSASLPAQSSVMSDTKNNLSYSSRRTANVTPTHLQPQRTPVLRESNMKQTYSRLATPNIATPVNTNDTASAHRQQSTIERGSIRRQIANSRAAMSVASPNMNDRYHMSSANRGGVQSELISPAPQSMDASSASSRHTGSASPESISEKNRQLYNRQNNIRNEMISPDENLLNNTFLRDISTNDFTSVNGRQYLILNESGKGGSSRVYKVLNEKRQVMALKRVHIRKSSPNFKSTFDSYTNEIELLRRLRGKSNIIYCYDAQVRRDMGLIYLVMEYGDIDLAKQLNETHKTQMLLDDNFRKVYWKQMLEAVKTIHEAKIVHGDLKPANFVIVAGTLKLIDFGIAKAIPTEDTTKIFRDAQIGTPNYMSPEALTSCDNDDDSGELMKDIENMKPKYKVSRASDIWSLGCILYQMVYGKPPFAHLTNIMKKMRCIQSESYIIPYPNVENNTVINVLNGCLQRDPLRRISIPQLLSHSYLNNSSSSLNGMDLSNSQWRDILESAYTSIIQEFKDDSIQIEEDEDYHKDIVRRILRKVPQEVSAKWSGGDSENSSSHITSSHSNGRRTGGMMMTPTTSAITHHGTKTNGYSLNHSMNGNSRSEG